MGKEGQVFNPIVLCPARIGRMQVPKGLESPVLVALLGVVHMDSPLGSLYLLPGFPWQMLHVLSISNVLGTPLQLQCRLFTMPGLDRCC